MCAAVQQRCVHATVIIQGLAFKGSILCVQQCNSHDCVQLRSYKAINPLGIMECATVQQPCMCATVIIQAA